MTIIVVMQQPPKILYPPRPRGKMTPNQLPEYEAKGKWVGQWKYNGTRSLFYIPADRKISNTLMINRHASFHKQFSPPKELFEQVLSLDLEKGKDYWLDGELLNAKTVTPYYKGKVVLYDVLHCGKYLFTKTLKQRLEMLNYICRNPQKLEPNSGIALEVSKDIWMAPTFYNSFVEKYKKFLHLPEIEGLVLKLLESFLDNSGQREYETNWLIRCRKPHQSGSYSF